MVLPACVVRVAISKRGTQGGPFLRVVHERAILKSGSGEGERVVFD